MLHTQKFPSEVDVVEPAGDELGGADKVFLLLATLRQHYRRLVSVALATAVFIAVTGTIYVRTAPPVYNAKAQVIIDRGKSSFLQQHGVLPDAPIDYAQVDSEIQLLTSARIAAKAVEKLHLADDPQFTGGDGGLTDAIANLFRRLGLVVRSEPKSPADRAQQATFTVSTNLQVVRVGLTYIIELTYQARRPERAIQVVNAIADAYVDDQMDSKYLMQRRASDWLQRTADELRQQAVANEEAVNTYKATNNIVTTATGGSISDQEIAELNRQLLEARSRTSDILARLNRIEALLRCSDHAAADPLPDRSDADACAGKEGTNGTVSDLLNNPIVIKLREQYLELLNREADYSTRYGPTHNAVLNLHNQIRDVQKSVLNELRRVADSYRSDYAIAKQRQETADRDLTRAVVQSQTTSKARATLRELESKAQSTRTVYEVFLQRYTESLQQQTYVNAEAHVLTSAGVAIQKPALKPAVLAALALLGGLGSAVGLAFLHLAMDRVFRTSAQIETALQVPCTALIPLMKADRSATRRTSGNRTTATGLRLISRDRGVFWKVVDAPLSWFTESIRSIKLAVDLRRITGVGTIVGFTSSIPNEGKTTTAAALALLAAQAGQRVLMIDCDLRNPSLTRFLAPDAEAGLVEAVRGERSFEEVSWHCNITGLTFLPAVVGPDRWNTGEILASSATKQLFERLRAHYDHIVVDLPPLAPIIDVRATSDLIDFYFLVVEWGATKIDVVKHALKGAHPILEHTLGTVLNKTDFDQMANYDRLKSQYYKNKHYDRYGYTTDR